MVVFFFLLVQTIYANNWTSLIYHRQYEIRTFRQIMMCFDQIHKIHPAKKHISHSNVSKSINLNKSHENRICLGYKVLGLAIIICRLLIIMLILYSCHDLTKNADSSNVMIGFIWLASGLYMKFGCRLLNYFDHIS